MKKNILTFFTAAASFSTVLFAESKIVDLYIAENGSASLVDHSESICNEGICTPLFVQVIDVLEAIYDFEKYAEVHTNEQGQTYFWFPETSKIIYFSLPELSTAVNKALILEGKAEVGVALETRDGKFSVNTVLLGKPKMINLEIAEDGLVSLVDHSESVCNQGTCTPLLIGTANVLNYIYDFEEHAEVHTNEQGQTYFWFPKVFRGIYFSLPELSAAVQKALIREGITNRGLALEIRNGRFFIENAGA
jgi:hypothetical protein